MDASAITLEDHAMAWWRESMGYEPPDDLQSEEWKIMYEYWATWAFSDLR